MCVYNTRGMWSHQVVARFSASVEALGTILKLGGCACCGNKHGGMQELGLFGMFVLLGEHGAYLEGQGDLVIK